MESSANILKFKTNRAVSIENDVVKSFISIETAAKLHKHQPADECHECLPKAIDDLIDNKMYRRKYRSMINQGYLAQLIQLVDYVRSHEAAGKIRKGVCYMFCEWAAKDNWAKTLKTLAKVAKAQETALRVATKLGVAVNRVIYRYVWSSANVERWADLAREVPHGKPGQSKIKHFIWLCKQDLASK